MGGVKDVAGIATLADTSRRLGDLETAGRLLAALQLPDDAAFARFGALRDVLDERGQAPSQAGVALPAPFVRRHDVLSADALAEVVRMTRERLRDFTASGVDDGESAGTTKMRKSVVLPDAQAFRPLVLPRVWELVDRPEVKHALGFAPLDPSKVELQVTGHGDRAYFKPHGDASHAANVTREVSFVFYFRLEPDGFSGGELKLFDASHSEQRYASEAFTTIEPDANSLILFPSRCMHEVAPVHVPSGDLSAGRFSANGWIHRA